MARGQWTVLLVTLCAPAVLAGPAMAQPQPPAAP
jgi:hypothetical protein